MSGPSRPSLHWLLWLVIALLPLRGWAWAAMLPAELTASLPVVHTVSGASTEWPPCHRVGPAPTTPARHAVSADPARHHTSGAADTADTAGTDHPGCTLCSLCHAAAAPAAMLALTLPDPLPEAAPSRTCAAPTPWSADAPERPPKA